MGKHPARKLVLDRRDFGVYTARFAQMHSASIAEDILTKGAARTAFEALPKALLNNLLHCLDLEYNGSPLSCEATLAAVSKRSIKAVESLAASSARPAAFDLNHSLLEAQPTSILMGARACGHADWQQLADLLFAAERVEREEIYDFFQYVFGVSLDALFDEQGLEGYVKPVLAEQDLKEVLKEGIPFIEIPGTNDLLRADVFHQRYQVYVSEYHHDREEQVVVALGNAGSIYGAFEVLLRAFEDYRKGGGRANDPQLHKLWRRVTIMSGKRVAAQALVSEVTGRPGSAELEWCGNLAGQPSNDKVFCLLSKQYMQYQHYPEAGAALAWAHSALGEERAA